MLCSCKESSCRFCAARVARLTTSWSLAISFNTTPLRPRRQRSTRFRRHPRIWRHVRREHTFEGPFGMLKQRLRARAKKGPTLGSGCQVHAYVPLYIPRIMTAVMIANVNEIGDMRSSYTFAHSRSLTRSSHACIPTKGVLHSLQCVFPDMRTHFSKHVLCACAIVPLHLQQL